MTTPAAHPSNPLAALRIAWLQVDGLRRLSPTGHRIALASQQHVVFVSGRAFATIPIANSDRAAPGFDAPGRSGAGQIPIARRMS
jgi:hypothetical protein